MNNTPSPNPGEVAEAMRELASLNAEALIRRNELASLRTRISSATRRVEASSAALIVEANEHLVIAAMQAHIDSERAAHELREVSRSLEIDALTQLPNRVRLLDRLGVAIANAKRHNGRLALMFVDLDEFKQINDALGHGVGDQVLKHVARCLTDSIRETDTASRHGGDEFLIVLGEITSISDTALVAEKIIAALGTPVRIRGHSLHLTASIGISIFPDDGKDIETLIDRADLAMYHAKCDRSISFSYHDEALSRKRSQRTAKPSRRPVLPDEDSLAEHEHHRLLLLEANEQLLLAALNAQRMQSSAEEAQLRQTDFLAVLAHELRNPLMPLGMAASLLGRVGANAAKLARLQAIIEGQVLSLSRLVDDLLDVSRVRTGKLSLEFKRVDLAVLVENAASAIRPALDMRTQSMKVRIPASPLPVKGDAVRLMQILGNLLGNASKYTQEGGNIDLSVELLSDTVVLTVADNGIGIDAASLPHIFDPFMQDVRAVAFNADGLGVGLTVVQELVKGHGGTITAHSTGSGCGSRFVVSLPSC